MIHQRTSFALVVAAALSCTASAEAIVVKVVADAELRENGTTGVGDATDTGSGLGPTINARWNFATVPTNRNEWAALKFDLSAYPDKSLLENVALRTYMYRTDANNSKNLRLYALTPGTSGEDWNEATITYGSMPGFTFDANSTTNILDVGGAIQSLGTFSVSGVGNEGNIALINPASITSFAKGMGENNLLSLLISYQDSATGQWRIASREATQTATGALTGAAGDFAAFLQFDVVSTGIRGDYNENGIVDAADYTVWRDKLGGSGLINEEVSPETVDIADYLYWKERFGATGPAGAGSGLAMAVVPEPPSRILALVVAIIASLRIGRSVA